MSTITVTTPRKNQYTYEINSVNASWRSVAGVYMFAYKQTNGTWHVLYVGQTNDFKARFAAHEKLPLAIKKGATHILARVNPSDVARKNEEAELIAWLSPALNELLK